MDLINTASGKSAWRGYEYYKEGKVLACVQTDESHFMGFVSGSGKEPYDVTIDVEHPKRSECTCPLAAGKRIVCKHMAALYFSAYPEKADEYMAEIERQQQAALDYREEITELVERRIGKMTKAEAQEALYEMVFDAPEWLFDRFVRRWVED